jgi:hypothetical protein
MSEYNNIERPTKDIPDEVLANSVHSEVEELIAALKLTKSRIHQYYSFKETETALMNVLNMLQRCHISVTNDLEKLNHK